MEQTILKHLIYDENYTRKVLPFLKDEYFTDRTDKLLFGEINDYIQKYNSNPTYEALLIQLNDKKITDEEYSSGVELLTEINESKQDLCEIDWLVDKSEKFCQDKAIYNGVVEAIQILDGKNKDLDKGSIPDILTKALSVGFDNNVGHDYIDNYMERYEYYHKVMERIPFDLDYFNKITNGGLPKKSLSIVVASTGVGKSLFKCHHAAYCLSQGKNVLYITLELAEEEVAKRIDSNLLNLTFDQLLALSKDEYQKRILRLKQRNFGKLVIKEYPTSSANSNHFRTLINELNLKKNFIPDIIFIDYLNICSSSRLRSSSSENSYTYVKSIAEEIRGLSVEYNVPILTSTQLNRSGSASSDPTVENVSESFGVAATCDMMFALVSTDELEQLNQFMVKQIKNRYSDPTKNKRFVVSVDRSKMKLSNAEQSAQEGIIDSGQEVVAQQTKSPFKKKSFEDFKFN
jgi:replicative DNA helicase